MILITNNMEHKPGEGGTAIKLAEDIYIDEECVRDVVRGILKKHSGRWEWNNEDEFFYSCSNCGHKAYGNTAEIVSGLYNYCPNCGAKMEVEENEND